MLCVCGKGGFVCDERSAERADFHPQRNATTLSSLGTGIVGKDDAAAVRGGRLHGELQRTGTLCVRENAETERVRGFGGMREREREKARERARKGVRERARKGRGGGGGAGDWGS